MNSISLDDPEFFQKINGQRPDLFNQEKMARNIQEEKTSNIKAELEDIFGLTAEAMGWNVEKRIHHLIKQESLKSQIDELKSCIEISSKHCISGDNTTQLLRLRLEMKEMMIKEKES